MKNEDRSPILVNNPYRDVLMNVEPLFHLIHAYSTDECVDISDTSIKIAALTSESEWVSEYQRKNVITFMYEVRSLFSAMNDCQIPIPNKKKGGTQ